MKPRVVFGNPHPRALENLAEFYRSFADRQNARSELWCEPRQGTGRERSGRQNQLWQLGGPAASAPPACSEHLAAAGVDHGQLGITRGGRGRTIGSALLAFADSAAPSASDWSVETPTSGIP